MLVRFLKLGCRRKLACYYNFYDKQYFSVLSVLKKEGINKIIALTHFSPVSHFYTP